jgi:hypothetical protein
MGEKVKGRESRSRVVGQKVETTVFGGGENSSGLTRPKGADMELLACWAGGV